jgi:agmatine/peptidylarginine deiminase
MTTDQQPRLIAEWEPQDAILLTWPHDRTDWAGLLPEVTRVYEALLLALCRHGDVVIAAREDMAADLARHLGTLGVDPECLHIHPAAYNDTWTRDHGPITVETGQGLCLLDYTFNGWGNKFDAALDNALTAALYARGAFPGAHYREMDFVLEGGSIETDGKGTLLTTARCLLHPNRNPGLGRGGIEERLRADLDITRFHWLEHGYLEGDDTDAHIDTLARFCPGDIIAYQGCDDTGDSHYQEFAAMERELQALTGPGGKPYTLIALPWPVPRYNGNGARLPLSYANFLIFNKAVFVPLYKDTQDGTALEQISRAFPGYTVEGVNCLPLVTQHGSLHCVTMQLPRGVIKP